jgi:uncharacterized protein (UPF0264 family)
MTRLLVSVRNAQEAKIALAAGVDLIDVKEPNAGPLGMASMETLDEIASVVAGRAPLSAACGELCDWKRDSLPASAKSLRSCEIDSRFQFAKIGLQSCAELTLWQSDWRAWRDDLPENTKPVLVMYADHETAKSPSIDQLLDFARAEKIQHILIDTFDKRGPGIAEILSRKEIAAIVDEVQREGRKIVLAGKLTLEQAESLLDLRPDFFAVRGAVCENAGNRSSELRSHKVAIWKELLPQQNIL